jgi:hypothetical protein
MPGFLVHLGATVMCSHGGQAMPASPFPRVTVGGQPIATIAAPYTVAGCAFAPPSGNGPCVTAQWLTGATRVTAGGVPVVLADSQAVCTPTGTPLIIAVTQVRVTGT